jgi:hypothetical protein
MFAHKHRERKVLAQSKFQPIKFCGNLSTGIMHSNSESERRRKLKNLSTVSKLCQVRFVSFFCLSAFFK